MNVITINITEKPKLIIGKYWNKVNTRGYEVTNPANIVFVIIEKNIS